MRHRSFSLLGCLLAFFPIIPRLEAQAAEKPKRVAYTQEQIEAVASKYHIPWTHLAAVVAYERNRTSKSTGIEWPGYLWAGIWNPDPQAVSPAVCRFFGGVGTDGDGDGVADPGNEQDSLTAAGNWLSRYGSRERAFHKALAEKYEREDIQDRIVGFASVFDTFRQYELKGYMFPIPKRYDCSFADTWGDRRGWGGRRIHEGTDIFAGYGTPVLAATYGYIEVKGWNDYGGWRIGLRGIDNVYYYYAHLSSFARGIHKGKVVKPGQVLGYVGSSGYGRPGTSGKFPPHLHFGMYRGGGIKEWAFDPYPYLRRWDRT